MTGLWTGLLKLISDVDHKIFFGSVGALLLYFFLVRHGHIPEAFPGAAAYAGGLAAILGGYWMLVILAEIVGKVGRYVSELRQRRKAQQRRAISLAAFERLSQQQKRVLFEAYKLGRREVALKLGSRKERWAEELFEQGFVESMETLSSSHRMPHDSFTISRLAWEIVAGLPEDQRRLQTPTETR